MTKKAEPKTADSQMQGSDADVAVTRKIRDRLTDMEGMSTRAQNITIVTEGKNVTLKGEVDKQEEIQKIMNVAKEEASGKTISNQLSVHK
jgi:osmotically-inducible protein OsmY